MKSPHFSPDSIGIMQGRLVDKINGQWQAFPKGAWVDEFNICKNIGVNAIEWIVDVDEIFSNPLIMPGGYQKILHQSKLHQVKVHSVCADFLLRSNFLAQISDPVFSEWFNTVVDNMLVNCSKLNVQTVVIPLLESLSLSDDSNYRTFLDESEKIAAKFIDYDIIPSLELDLPPRLVTSLLSKIHSSYSINYDTGNSASLGYDPETELCEYGSRIFNIHIKDRNYLGGSVPLGDGAVNFVPIMEYLQNNYTGICTYEAYRDDEGIEIFKKQRRYFNELFTRQ